MKTIFWLSVAIIAYVYVGYPVLIAAWARLVRPTRKRVSIEAMTSWPSISIIIAARDEAARLPARLTNLLTIPYAGRREIIVVSDGSTDDTRQVVGVFGRAVRLVEVPAGGKPLALNAGVAVATGDVLLFADARQEFSANALEHLAKNFVDPQVGGVTGELVLDAEQDSTESTVGDGVGLYWRYEKWLRRSESTVWSTLGATGAIYALRRDLWRPLPAGTLLDDVLAPMRVVLGGRRIVFEEEARAFDRASADAEAESRRKVRTLAGNYQILSQEPRLLVPIVNPVWLQYVSHKLGRLLVPWALLGSLFASAALMFDGWLYACAFGVQALFYLVAAYGGWREHRTRRSAEFSGTLREVTR